MGNHDLTTYKSKNQWMSACTCGAHSEHVERRWQAEDWETSHLMLVARVRAHLGGRSPSLKDQRDWYRKQAAAAETDHDRHLWEILATGLAHRLGDPPEDTPLWAEQ